jgi:hypothetical protein
VRGAEPECGVFAGEAFTFGLKGLGLQDVDAGVLRGELRGDAKGAVGGAIVDDEDVPVFAEEESWFGLGDE